MGIKIYQVRKISSLRKHWYTVKDLYTTHLWTKSCAECRFLHNGNFLHTSYLTCCPNMCRTNHYINTLEHVIILLKIQKCAI